MSIRFTKMQGAGNDFVVIDGRRQEQDWSKLAMEMCQHHFGVGADGLLVLLKSSVADYRMCMFNPDGSEAEACGNGLRCLARYVTDALRLGSRPTALRVETLAGVREIHPLVKGNRVVEFRVNMGPPCFEPDQIPISLSRQLLDIIPIVDYPLSIDGAELKVTCVSMGNPHAVSFIEGPVADFPLTRVGPLVERHPLFPKRTNFEVVHIVGQGRVEARVWERGAGETLACGSGACAIGVAWRLHHKANDSVEVLLPGGLLKVDWDGRGDVLLTGPAEIVFHGDWPGG